MGKRSIYLMRHCQTQLSLKKRLIGQCDVKLSEEGISLAHKIGKNLKNNHFQHIVSSPLARAKETASIISSHINICPKEFTDLNEISLGKWDGMFIDDIRRAYPEEYRMRGKDMVHYRVPQGENFIDLSKRVLSAYNKVLELNGDIIIVAHKSVNRIILAQILDIPIENMMKISQDYGCVNIIIQQELDISVKCINARMI